ncbi:MAG: Rmt family 16S rRNA (guanine(1405)-N(7))-methyltransferase [Lachnospiraceae bacterium]|nr:Rmt family 16S rRNA (guanine(1405)-N(7))-methyltransferase [Lachnospiraceae bacterium]
MKIEDITTEVLNSKKYANVDKNVVARISAEIIPRYPKRKDVIKAVKKELHIIHESFLQDDCYLKVEQLLTNYPGKDINKDESFIRADKEFALKLLALHSSTKERLRQVEEIYQYLNKYIQAEDEVIDIGCGFNPLALPFLENKPQKYTAFDISSATISILNKYFELSGFAYQAAIYDAAAGVPGIRGDILLLFKLFPLLEYQKKGRAFELLNSLDCRRYIISFPTKSASGKEKGMEQYYSSRFEKELPEKFSIIEKKVFLNEMFYILERKNF